jgi:type II secretory pathway pseudopilin PulG
VELMIVIAIIGVLVTILAVALGPILSTGPAMVTRNDINQLGIALESFKSQFGFYPPSMLVLCENQNDYDNRPAWWQESKYYLLKMFPRLSSNPAWTGPAPANFIDWNQDGKYTGNLVLTGDQCLVFFLGGIQTTNPTTGAKACNGFSTNPANPIPAGGATTYGPYFEFKSERLVMCPRTVKSQGFDSSNIEDRNGYFSYQDGYKQIAPPPPRQTSATDFYSVYAYFSSGRTRNGYNAHPIGDCPFLSALNPLFVTNPQATPLIPGVFPYQQSAGNYHNPNTYQIISPGKDGIFGAGSPVPNQAALNPNGYYWTAAPNTPYSPDKVPGVPSTAGLGDGRDDITNFNATLLGKL